MQVDYSGIYHLGNFEIKTKITKLSLRDPENYLYYSLHSESFLNVVWWFQKLEKMCTAKYFKELSNSGLWIKKLPKTSKNWCQLPQLFLVLNDSLISGPADSLVSMRTSVNLKLGIRISNRAFSPRPRVWRGLFGIRVWGSAKTSVLPKVMTYSLGFGLNFPV